MAVQNEVHRNENQSSEALAQPFRFIEEATVPISIKFENLSYSVKENRSSWYKSFNCKKTQIFEFKQILEDVSGRFSSGELTAILGASGSGKTTLLNILSGYVKKNVKGKIEMNEEACDVKLLRKLSAYVMQSDLLQPHLTAEEQMMIVAKLKLPHKLDEKKMIVTEFMNFFNLGNCCGTRIENLSGGERKRLSIALELISSPPIIFLDEPTSGLDSVTIDLCMGIFRRLALSGKTVICTIHQPTVSIMNQFDQVYFLAKGACIYNGSTDNILPFLTSLNLTCPITFSYSEFIIETVETNPETIQLLSDAIQNGKLNNKTVDPSKNDLTSYQNEKIEKYYNRNKFHASFWIQFAIIFHRMMVQQWRNKVGLIIQLFSHILIAVIFGMAFFGVGNSAKSLMSNVYFSWMSIMFFLYNPIMTYITVFPIEMEILKREYLNRWYSLRAYYLALSLRSFPITVILGTGLVVVAYFLSGQPLEIERFFRFTLTCILVSIASEGFGLVIGSTFGTLGGTILGPALIGPIAIIPLYGLGFGKSLGLTIRIIMRISYIRFGYIAALYSLMDDRPPLTCSDDSFCYYKDTKHLLRDLGIANNTYCFEILGLIAHALLFRIIAYLVLKHRMRQELNSKNSDYLAKLLQIKN